MPHPNGGKGNYFGPLHAFEQAYEQVGHRGLVFASTTGESIHARQGLARDGITLTILFQGENNIHGNVCHSCWGYRCNCSGARIGQCTEALDRHMTTLKDH